MAATAGSMIITSGAAPGCPPHGAEVHCPFPGPHSTPCSYSGYAAACLGRAHVTCGAVCIVLEVLGLGVDLENHKVASGIWCGLLFICAGAVGVVCGQRNTTDWIKSSLVATLLASLFTTGPLISCSMAVGNFGARFLCWMLMAASTAELIVALSNVVICMAAIWPQYFHFIGIQVLVAAPVHLAGRGPGGVQVLYGPPGEEAAPDQDPATSHHQAHSRSAQSSGLRPPTCVVIPPTPSPPPCREDSSSHTPLQDF